MSVITDMNYGMLSTVDPEVVAFNTSASALTAAAYDAKTTVELWATEDCYIAFGKGSAVAASTTHPLTAKIPRRFTLVEAGGPGTYIAVLGMINSGSLYISVVVS